MSDERPPKELMISFNYLFPEALAGDDTREYTGRIADRIHEVIAEELNRLDIQHRFDSMCFLHLGTEIIPDSTRCSDCGAWVIPSENAHSTSVVASGYTVDDGRILCEQCWSLFDGDKL
ncbi:hypothetical protein ACFQY0_21180 [Haloferula chungangensis]|uniref:Uncharacterized protein n=1 Tax=Haloferula chungangensis TaxID=1048331 RepID=A0ABW2LB80_9BACT